MARTLIFEGITPQGWGETLGLSPKSGLLDRLQFLRAKVGTGRREGKREGVSRGGRDLELFKTYGYCLF